MNENEKAPVPGILINVDEAVVRTATIEIRMLTIDRRKVTLSLFRQFKQRALLNPDTGQQVGVPWGLINYFWQGCNAHGAENKHLHVLWQDGQELFRDCFYPESKGNFYRMRSSASSKREQAPRMALLATHLEPDRFVMWWRDDGRYSVAWKGDSNRCWNMNKRSNTGHSTVYLIDLDLQEKSDWIKEYDLNQLREAVRSEHRNAEAEELWKMSFATAEEADDLFAKAKQLESQWDHEAQVIAALPQLFIAG